MLKARLALGLSTLAALPLASARADEDRSPHRALVAPARSGEGSLPFTSSNVHLLGWLPLADLSGGATSGNDCWGYTAPSGREYAIIGTDDGTVFVEVTDPGTPTVVSFQSGPSSLWRDMKTYGDNAYVVSEGGSGIQVFDMSNIDAGTVTLVNTITTGGCTTATHNIAIDETSGFLYRLGGSGSPCGGAPQGLVIYSLANPDNPSFVALYSTRYCHDAQVLVSTRPGPLNGRQLAFCAMDDGSGGGTANLHILDVTNKASITTVATEAYSSNVFSHQVWVSPDQTHAYLNDEIDEQTFGFNTRTRVFDVSNPANPVFLGQFSSGSTSIDHNLYVHDGKIFEANYRSGLRVFDATIPSAPTVYGFFDTYEADDAAQFNGLWSNYPFFPSGTVIGSDLERGLFVWRLGAPKLTLSFPGGTPELIGPSGGTVQFQVTEGAPGDLAGGTVQFHYRSGVGPFSTASATFLGGDTYQAALPSGSCGDTLQYYVSAQDDDGVTWTDPPASPTQVHNAVVAFGETLSFEDEMEVNTGWAVNVAADLVGFSVATTGAWVRVDPNGTAAQPENDHTDSPGTDCWVTGQGTVGGSLGENDIDGGATSLRSPALNATGMNDPYISYWRWYSNQTNGVVDDVMTIDISNNNGSTWTNVETLGPTGSDSVGGWILHTFRVADFVAPSSTLRIRLVASDVGSGSIVEAGIDDLRMIDYECTPLTVSTISASSGPWNGGNIVQITGTEFGPDTTVRFGPNQATVVNVLNSTTLNVIVPPNQGLSGGKLRWTPATVDVIVQNPGTGVLPGAYTYVLAPRSF